MFIYFDKKENFLVALNSSLELAEREAKDGFKDINLRVGVKKEK